MSAYKPTPLKVYGRSHYACNRCKVSKIKCSGGKPCANCKNNGRSDDCVYPSKDRKIVIMESDLNKLHDRVKFLEEMTQKSPESINSSKTPPRKIEGSLLGYQAIIQERQNEETREFLFNHSGLENFLISDSANESIKWRILTSHNVMLPMKNIALQLIDTVFENYGSEFYLIDYKSLMGTIDIIYRLFDSIKLNDITMIEDLNKQITRSTLCYFFILIAYGEQISNLRGSNDEIAGLQFYMIASELFNLTHERISLDFIRSAVLMALYSANLNRYNTVYNYFGVAIRSAISQGFHRQLNIDENDKDALIYREKAKRLWWTIFITDATWTAKMNMPAQIDYTETDVDLPLENSIDLYDSFDLNSLELNVQLGKYISKSVQKIYGAHKRTISVNYINTDQFNQRVLIKNVLSCFNELIKNFEVPYLFQYKGCNIIEHKGRKVVNLFLRFNLLISIITKPLISLIFKRVDNNIYEHPIEIEEAINKAISTAIANINILLKLFEIGRLFTIGFYDSQYLYTSILIIIMSSITDEKCLNIVNKAVAMLKYMAQKGNINAQNSIKKLLQVNEYLAKTPELDFLLDFNLNIEDVIEVKSVFNYTDHYYNTYETCPFSTFSEFKMFKDNIHKTLEYHEEVPPPPAPDFDMKFSNIDFEDENLIDSFTNNRVHNLSGTSQNTLFTMMNELQNTEELKSFSL
ncbi:hypothetical protein CLIB1444_11S03488 [[Candida] jaroonii]|uniref:Uncharacterized protein n=1 Tax=[Candida] jaroonii TaxID=467808 RepID=A0ACA9YD92_9ASCO|nr:hypothetical protein CLIB1444_11S03488 [[Candida] jaroonii]